MALSEHEQNILKSFAEDHFRDLPMHCIELFKEEPKIPGYGKVECDDDALTMKVALSISLVKSYELMESQEDNLSVQLADLFAQEYSMHLCELLLEVLTNEENMVSTSVSKLLKYCKIERSPIIITSQTMAGIFAKERSFVDSGSTSVDVELGYLYELGKIRNVTIVVDPLQENERFAYLLTGNIIDYKMGLNDKDKITYQLSEDNNDLIAIFKPVTLYYQVDVTGINFKFFNITDEY